MGPWSTALPPTPLAQGPAAAGEPIPGVKLVGRSAWGLRLAQWPWPNRGQPVGAKRESSPSLRHLSKGAVVLAWPPGLHMGETPPWRTDIDEDQKKRVAIFHFGVISGASSPSGGKSPSPTAPGYSAPPSWDGSGSTARAAASWNPSTPWAGMTGAAGGPWTRTPPRP
ncbi:hypothetical protein DFAR_2090024 [Desulfarculales bacterium]